MVKLLAFGGGSSAKAMLDHGGKATFAERMGGKQIKEGLLKKERQ